MAWHMVPTLGHGLDWDTPMVTHDNVLSYVRITNREEMIDAMGGITDANKAKGYNMHSGCPIRLSFSYI